MKGSFPLAASLFLLLIAGIAAPSSRADSAYLVEYAVNGTLTATGTNACHPSPCVETINFSFIFGAHLGPDYGNGYMYVEDIVPGTMSVNSSGSLGSVLGSQTVVQGYFIPFYAGGAEIDLYSFPNTWGPGLSAAQALVLPPFAPEFYSCAFNVPSTVTPAPCIADFSNVPGIQEGVGVGGQGGSLTLTYTETQVPEPPQGLLLVFGLSFVALAAAFHRRSLTHLRSALPLASAF